MDGQKVNECDDLLIQIQSTDTEAAQQSVYAAIWRWWSTDTDTKAPIQKQYRTQFMQQCPDDMIRSIKSIKWNYSSASETSLLWLLRKTKLCVRIRHSLTLQKANLLTSQKTILGMCVYAVKIGTASSKTLSNRYGSDAKIPWLNTMIRMNQLSVV